ncbi:WD40 repeat domain-containing protein [Actinomadura sp. HBU206391]|uniref:WD40 repeat domain-containing protein n=1 Tax=Actinomadura sp. HBU206391 TaxID=2731692 RepID=UPI0016505411|nr:WD40 repeat domain-containing protein [Actinomadura sp. HBU206391]MBC6457645.1 WD40 repeat domain-containing protein [Actinomadura sp. HBU206391]
MTVIETTLSSSDPSKPRFYRVRLDGRRLIGTAWAEGRSPRETVKDLDVDTDHLAVRAFDKARDKKMREGFCHVADVAGAARGDVVLEFLVPNRSPAEAFDLSPDGRTLVVATTLKEAYGAEIHLVDVATGHRRLLRAEEPQAGSESSPKRQTFLHAVLFDAGGQRIVYALNEETRVLDIATGAIRTLARYRQFRDSRFNPFRVRPSWDRARGRLLVFDTGDRVRVLDPDWRTVFETSTAGSSFECRAGALSPSGRLLALVHGKGSIYSQDDPAVTELEVWDVENGTAVHRFAVDRPVHRIGFDPSEGLLVVNPESVQGPGAFSLETGTLAWHFPAPYRTDRWDDCYAWAYSADGKMLAVGRRGLTDVIDATSRESDPAFGRRPESGGTGRTYGVKISDDGTLVASGGDSGRIVVRRL